MERKLPEGWKQVSFSDIASIERDAISGEEILSQAFYVGLEHIEKNSGRLIKNTLEEPTALKSSKFKFNANHILYGKLRPYLNKVWLADCEGVCSTDIIPIHPNESKINQKYLYYYVKSDAFAKMATSRSSGANLPRISPEQILHFPVPLPSLEIQLRIVEILAQAEVLRTKRLIAIENLDTLASSIFHNMFGDPVRNPKGWPCIKLGEHATKIGSGATPTGGEAAYKNSGIALIRSMNVRDGFFLYTDLAFIDEAQAAKLDGVVVEAGDILLNITGASVARVCRVPDDVLPARVNQHVAIIRPALVLDTLFLEQLLLYPSMKRRLLNISHAGATREAITKAQIEQLIVICPPQLNQQSFASRVDVIEKLKASHRASLNELDALFASLQDRAFRGEL